MPILRWAASRIRPIWPRLGPIGKAALAAVLVPAAIVYVFFGPLWFDVAYITIARLLPRSGPARRRLLALGAAVAVLALIAAATPPAGRPSHSIDPRPVAAVATSPGGGPVVSATPVSPGATLVVPSPTDQTADADDEAGTTPPPEPSHAVTGGVGSSDLPAGRLAGEPDPRLTPGALNPAVTQATIGTTICVSGWTATVRPGSSYTTRLKVQQIALYGYADTSTASYEEDHLIPLELGGAPSDAANLWPQPWYVYLPDGRPAGARTKDAYETSLRKQVCAGTLTLADAQSRIGAHWVHSYYGIALASDSSAPPPPPTAPSPTIRPTLEPTGEPIGAPTDAPTAACDPSYPTVCIHPAPPDLDCPDIPYRNFTVLPPDPHGFDRDHDGVGCEG